MPHLPTHKSPRRCELMENIFKNNIGLSPVEFHRELFPTLLFERSLFSTLF